MGNKVWPQGSVTPSFHFWFLSETKSLFLFLVYPLIGIGFMCYLNGNFRLYLFDGHKMRWQETNVAIGFEEISRKLKKKHQLTNEVGDQQFVFCSLLQKFHLQKNVQH